MLFSVSATHRRNGVIESLERFSRNVREQRIGRGLSQERLGGACGLHRTEISLLERGARDPRLSTVVRIARALDVPAASLLEGIE